MFSLLGCCLGARISSFKNFLFIFFKLFENLCFFTIKLLNPSKFPFSKQKSIYNEMNPLLYTQSFKRVTVYDK